MFEIDDTPYVGRKERHTGRYDATFDSMKFGQCVRVKPEEVTRVSAAMRYWIKKHDIKDAAVREAKNMPDGYGRVWLLSTRDE